jgi:hypothetical protein
VSCVDSAGRNDDPLDENVPEFHVWLDRARISLHDGRYEEETTFVILGNRITYRVLGPIPLVIRLPADETCRAIAQNVASGDFSSLPTPLFVIWPYLGAGVGIIAFLGAGVFWLRRKRASAHR